MTTLTRQIIGAACLFAAIPNFSFADIQIGLNALDDGDVATVLKVEMAMARSTWGGCLNLVLERTLTCRAPLTFMQQERRPVQFWR
jgi:hypothetical protein